MNWIKLHQDYPLAYKRMEEAFNCLYTETEVTGMLAGRTMPNLKIKHPLERDLYDFFDGEGIWVHSGNNAGGFYCFILQADNDSVLCKKKPSRPEAETEAFTKAMEILNDKLK